MFAVPPRKEAIGPLIFSTAALLAVGVGRLGILDLPTEFSNLGGSTPTDALFGLAAVFVSCPIVLLGGTLPYRVLGAAREPAMRAYFALFSLVVVQCLAAVAAVTLLGVLPAALRLLVTSLLAAGLLALPVWFTVAANSVYFLMVGPRPASRVQGW